MKYNTKWLLDEIKNGNPVDFVLFWGHTPSKNGEITKTCLSQWFEISFMVDGVKYLSAEHWMMAEKAKTFGDLEILPEILLAENPKIVKDLGRKIKNFDENIWDKFKYESVKNGNFHKFNQNAELKKYLLSTENKVLVEASPYDKVWGIGLEKENPNSLKPQNWNGENLLGFALMEVRNELLKSI